MIMVSPRPRGVEGGSRLAVVVTVAKGYDLGYIWKTQAQPGAGPTTGGYYIHAGGSPAASYRAV
jgi:hypothetical protein